MDAPLALSPGLEKAGALLVALTVAGALLAPGARARAWWTVAALLVCPAVLVGEVAETDQWDPVRERPALAVLVAVLGLGLVAALAALLRRRPGLLPLLAVAALPFRVPIAVGGATFNLLLPLYLVVAAGSLAFAWGALRAGDAPAPPRRPAARRLELALVAFVALYAVQALYTEDLEAATNTLVFFLAPFALLFARLSEVTWTPRIAAACFGVLAAVALVLVGIGFVEYATRTLLLNPKVIDANAFAEYFRVNSLFFDPNIYGRFLALVMLAVTSVLLWAREERTGLGAALGLAVLWAGLVLTFSQSSVAALLVGLAVLAALRWDARRTVLVAAAGLVLAALVVVAGQRALKLDLDSSRSIDRATSGRANLVEGGVDMVTRRPVLGWGSGSFALVYRETQRGSRLKAVSASHTIPLTVAAEQGIPGLVVYLAVLLAAFALLVRGARGSPLRAFLLAGFGALVLHTMVYAAFLEDPSAWALLGVAAALPEPG